MSVTNNFTAGGVLKADELNTNFSDVVSLATSVGNAQISGGITHDKLADNSAISWVHLNIVPYCADNNWKVPVAASSVIVPNDPVAGAGLYRVVPVMRPGWEAFLCAIMITTGVIVTTGDDEVQMKFRLNRDTSSGLIGNSAVKIDADDSHFILAKADPIANPLIAMSDGDYIDVSLYKTGTAGGDVTPTARNIDAYFTFKHVLVG